MPFNTPIEDLIAQSEAFYARYPRGGASADELKAQRARDIAVFNADPVARDIGLIEMKDHHTEADKVRLSELRKLEAA